MVDNSSKLKTEIERLKREKNARYPGALLYAARSAGSSRFPGRFAGALHRGAEDRRRIILFAGVHFMAETAKILSPDKKVLLPEPEAGCSLADSCSAPDFERFLRDYNGYTVVSYVNTSVGVKALTDICCTSGNAVQVIESLPADAKIVFAPDRNLGNYIKQLTGRQNMVVWTAHAASTKNFRSKRSWN